MFYDFSLYDPVDDLDTNHCIQACSFFSVDFDNMPLEPVTAELVESANSVDVKFELGWWHEGFGLTKAAIGSLMGQIRQYLEHGYGALDWPFILYGQSGQATVGVYIGQGLIKQGLSDSALCTFHDIFDTLDVRTPSFAMQLCGPAYDSTCTFGIAVTSNATFTPIQNAIKSWANTTCLSFLESKNFTGKATFTMPLQNGTMTNSTARVPGSLNTGVKYLQVRADCRTVQVVAGEGCAELAVKCGISGADFDKYNPGICGSLKPKQHVCCSKGTLPDLWPKPNSDGLCFSYKVQNDDNCANLEAEYGLTNKEIEGFNKNT